MNARALLAVLAALMLAAVPATADDANPGSSYDGDECEPHPPIVVSEDVGLRGFVLGTDPATGEPIYRPGSGVVDGSGTAEDPYVIEGWCIQAPPSQVSAGPVGLLLHKGAITLEGTSAHVVVQDNHLEAAADPPTPSQRTDTSTHGLVLADADNVHVAENTITGTDGHAIQTTETDNVALTGNEVRDNRGNGITIGEDSAPLVRGNTIVDNEGPGVRITGTEGPRIVDNAIEANAAPGLRLQATSNVTVAANAIADNARGLLVIDTHDLVLADNRITGHDMEGLRAPVWNPDEFNTGLAIRDNTFAGNGWDDLEIAITEDSRVTNNTADAYRLSIDASTVENNTVHTLHVRNSQATTIAANDASRIEVKDPGGDVQVRDNRAGSIQATFGHGLAVADNTIEGGNVGFSSWITSDLGLANNTIHDTQTGVEIRDGSDVQVHHNTIQDADERGVHVADAERVRLDANRIQHTPVGAEMRGTDLALRGNVLADIGDLGLHVHGHRGGVLDARENWWGDASGPSGGQPDACSEAIADGEGAALLVGPPPTEADVCFAPWLETPNPDAGAG